MNPPRIPKESPRGIQKAAILPDDGSLRGTRDMRDPVIRLFWR